MIKSFFREIMLFLACAVFTGTVGLILLDTVIMPYVVRKGQQVEVPDIVDLTQPQARSKLARRGLWLRLEEPRWDDSIQEGRIVFQSPKAFSRVKPGRTVTALPSGGPRVYKVPKLHGLSLRRAGLWIEQSSLVVGEVREEPSNRVKEGLVMGQDPAAGVEVPLGTPVSFVISSGPQRETVILPDLVGKSLKAARADLTAMGLEVRDIRYEFSTAYVPNTVIKQVPESGEEVKQGTGIRLVVNKL